MKRTLIAVAAVAGLLSAGCAASSPKAVPVVPAAASTLAAAASTLAAGASTLAAGASTTAAAVSSPIVSATPLAFYAAQFERLAKPTNGAFAEMARLPDPAPDAEFGAAAAKIVPVLQAADAAFLRAQWPANVTADVKAMVVAHGPLLGDLANLTASNVDQMGRDLGSAGAAASIVRADLGLPPAT